MKARAALEVGGREVAVSSPDKVLFGEAGVTKLELARYAVAVAEVALPHLRGRPLALQTFPAGVERKGFYLKAAPEHFPAWIRRVTVPRHKGGELAQAVAERPETLVYLAGQNVVTLHIGTSRADRLERPDRLVIDLDPGPDQPFSDVQAAALAAGDLLRAVGLEPYSMTTGSRGLHVVAPVQRRGDHEAVRGLAQALADRLAAEDPDRLTTAFRVADREGRLYLDVGRNGWAQHAVAPYSPRGLPDAPVATPLRWAELEDPGLSPRGWTVRTLPDRLRELGGDPWRDIADAAAGLAGPRRALERLG